MSDKITVVLPPVSEDSISNSLRDLTQILEEHTGRDNVQGILGGRHGYGVEFKNEVFEMHPFYWGDCICGHAEQQDDFYDELKHEDSCYQTELTNALIAEGYKLTQWGTLDDDTEWSDKQKDRETTRKFYSFKSTKAKELSIKHGFDPEVGIYVHCNCSYNEHSKKWHEENTHSDECPIDWPNFRHFASGVEITWYKYIGRDMQINKEVTIQEWLAIFVECVNSLNTEGELTTDA